MSTGDRTILGKISKRGNRYLRVLFVQAAWVVLIKPKIWERNGLTCGRRHGKHFLTFLQHWSGAVTCPAC
jgi:transposase